MLYQCTKTVFPFSINRIKTNVKKGHCDLFSTNEESRIIWRRVLTLKDNIRPLKLGDATNNLCTKGNHEYFKQVLRETIWSQKAKYVNRAYRHKYGKKDKIICI